ncbi:hypothetical protein AVBRAN12654_07520 [Campylobacter sp. RM12654]|uniref:hypothetical protein n=1 Tax=Campylobacter sp. RM12654 TaxID=2735738 RepID=UPI00301536EC|nr:hypothetical protein [Campylobacter sp. RM12654]
MFVIYCIIIFILFAFILIINGFPEFVYLVWKAFKRFDITYPLISLTIFTILFLLFIKKIKKLKFKTFLTISLIIISFEMFFIRPVVDYSSFNNFSYVFKSNYEKDLKGYCVKENKILSKDELLRIATNDFLDKTIVYYKNIANKYEKDRVYFYTLDEVKEFNDLKLFDLEKLQQHKINTKNYLANLPKLLKKPLFLSTPYSFDIVFFNEGFKINNGYLEFLYTRTDSANITHQLKSSIEIDNCGNTNRAIDEEPCFDFFGCKYRYNL